MVKVALVVSIIALAVCLLTALHGVLSDGLKGLKQRSKPIGISFLIYAVAFLLFIFFQCAISSNDCIPSKVLRFG